MVQKERLIGLSTTYYASKEYSIYEPVLKTVDLCFDVVELGATHAYEHNIHNTLLKKKDFPHVKFTVHTLFPPLKKRTWFNSANEPSEINKEIVDGLF